MIEIEKPKIECTEDPANGSYGKFTVEPLERGYGITLGNALRRIMLSSLPGTAATSIKIAGVQHEFSTIPGVKEDVTEIVLNIKNLITRLHNADGIKEFIRTVVGVQEHRSVSLLFSAVVEKEYEKMIAEICESVHPTSIVVTQIDGARVVPAEVLSDVFRKYTDAEIFTEPDVEKAFTQALAKKGDGMLFCAGSLYLVGDIKAILQRRKSNADCR